MTDGGGIGWCAPQPSANGKPGLRALFDKLAANGPPLVVVDQAATTGALCRSRWPALPTTKWPMPGLAMRRIAELCPGRAKTDARAAFVMGPSAPGRRPRPVRVTIGVATAGRFTRATPVEDPERRARIRNAEM
ncbi:transposase [Actinosynnema sp. NPDC059335]|uniref:IS110 family transposase n=1 Tax=Actinosynnema sp. NPDC059335 TaxID=3346804 RepID=UPI003672DC02